jgi:2-C-methyl-D-erythritol 4-phosphate cytidylyltransferase
MDYIIIVAGGKGLRMGSDIPKQFLPIGGKPVLMRTLERFREYSAELQIILVLPEAQQAYWHQLCEEYHFDVEYTLANGGQTRFHSVQNGLAKVPDDAQGVVGVHDGVRPFPSIEVIRNCYETARTAKAVIPVIPVVETVRQLINDGDDFSNGLQDLRTFSIDEDKNSPISPVVRCQDNSLSPVVRCQKNSKTVPRDQYRLVQTPQTFDIQLLKAANRQPYNDGFTDDASVVESYGYEITLVEGNRENIKITTPYDMKIAEVLI